MRLDICGIIGIHVIACDILKPGIHRIEILWRDGSASQQVVCLVLPGAQAKLALLEKSIDEINGLI